MNGMGRDNVGDGDVTVDKCNIDGVEDGGWADEQIDKNA
jgi:hypothetical protein